MNALQPLEPDDAKKSPPLRPRRRKQRRRHSPYTGLVIETTVQLLVHGALSVATVATLLRLLPYHLSTQTKLAEIRQEVAVTEERVHRLRDNFRHNFSSDDPRRTMQEQSQRIDPNRLQVVFNETKASILLPVE